MSNQDCLVLKIEEIESESKKLDNTLFVVYDSNEDHFIVRGKRIDDASREFVPYSFMCEDAKSLANFISFTICKSNLWSYTLYNYDNLPYYSENITYEFLVENEDMSYEITGYDNQKYNRKQLLSNLRMLRNVFNYY